MYESNRSSSSQYPRRKIFLSSLSHLMERKLAVQPEIEVNNKLFPHRNYAKKLSLHHQRAKSNVQLRTHKFDLHWTTKQSNNIPIQSNASPAAFKPSGRPQGRKHEGIRSQFRSTRLTANTMLVPTTARPLTQEMYSSSTLPAKNSYQSESMVCSQKNFLRKGSSLQKQIVVNLLRSKLLKEREQHEKKEYSNSEIIQMIQVFKGVTLSDTKFKKGIIAVESPLATRKKTDMKEIKGWELEATEGHEGHDGYSQHEPMSGYRQHEEEAG